MNNNNTSHNKYIAYTGLFTTLIILGSFIKIPIPLIHMTFQYFFIALGALLLGAKYSTLSVGLYIALGLIGLPVFTTGGGITYILFPTFGYLIGYMIGAFFMGYFGSKVKATFKNYFIITILGLFIIHLIGVPYYYFISHYVIKNTLTLYEILIFCAISTAPGNFIQAVIVSRIAIKLKEVLHLS